MDIRDDDDDGSVFLEEHTCIDAGKPNLLLLRRSSPPTTDSWQRRTRMMPLQ